MAEPADHADHGPDGDSASLLIDASAERLYGIVSDVTRMGRLSPECTGGRWIGGATGPAVGAKFRGTNRRGPMWWFTHNEVTVAEEGREFTFRTKESGAQWSYRFEPRDEATLVTETRSMWRDRPAVARWFSKLIGGTEVHDREMVDGLATTLERLREVAEETGGDAPK